MVMVACPSTRSAPPTTWPLMTAPTSPVGVWPVTCTVMVPVSTLAFSSAGATVAAVLDVALVTVTSTVVDDALRSASPV